MFKEIRGDGLASNLPNLFGSLAGASNARVAEFYRAEFRAEG